MARYIDTQKVTVPRGFFNKDLGVPDLLKWLEAQPDADVVPRSVIAKIFAEIEGITHRMSTPVGEYTVVPNGRYAELKKRYTEDNNDS